MGTVQTKQMPKKDDDWSKALDNVHEAGCPKCKSKNLAPATNDYGSQMVCLSCGYFFMNSYHPVNKK